MFHALQLEIEDNVATLVSDVSERTTLTVQTPSATISIVTTEPIAFGHKVALQSIPEGKIITKYGRPIGRAITHISKGGYVVVNNIEGMRGRGDIAEAQGGSK
jgi:altronate dehydratase small subunit